MALDGVRANKSADAARALERMTTDSGVCAECGRRGAVPVLVAALTATELEVVLPCCRALARICAHTAELQDDAIAAGVLQALLACMSAHGELPSALVACCRVLERLATGVAAAARREAAADAGVLPVLCSATRRWDHDEATGAACRAALRSLTRDAAALQDIARAAGAEPRWLI